ncbi:MAG: S8 family serine peptidase, partial [Candidatus Sumerlaeota bacterium]
MIRRFFIPGAIAAAAFVAAGTGSMAASVSQSPSVLSTGAASDTTAVELVRATDSCAIYYDASLTESEFLARAEDDAKRLGLTFVKTLAIGKVLIVKGTEQEVRNRLASAEGIPASHVGPSYLLHGDINARSITAFTNRVLIRFADSATEAAKEQFYSANGLTRIKEYGSGDVIVESSHSPDAGMIDVASAIAARAGMVSSASSDLLITGEQTANSDSIEITDPLFKFQWYLFNSVVNTNFDGGTADEDLDVPRAWMINQRNFHDAPGASSNGTYGDSEIVVGILDSGIQISHEDLAENIDPAVGFSAIGGQPINSGGGTLAAHGTFMAGLIAGVKNDKGIIGVAPGVKLYSLKIFANDLSTSTGSVSQVIDQSVSAGVDINVHPYSLVLNDTDASADSIEASLRRSFESGRGGLGTSNFASSGNFHAQVEYPAQSQWAVAVGLVSSDGLASDGDGADQEERTGIPRHNWGGKGIDFVMPSYATTGIVSTDVTGSGGIESANPNLPGNEAGNYAAVDFVENFNSGSFTSFDTATRYKGTSVAAALAGGVAALLLSDERYTDLPPFLHLDSDATRAERRKRAPLRGQENFDNLLSRMKNFSDLPNGNDLFYIDQSSEFYGFGRPNPARALSLPNTGSNVTPDNLNRGLLESDPFYKVVFDGMGLAGDNDTDAAADTLAKGWTAGQKVNAAVAASGPSITISPYLEGLDAIYFEDGSSKRSDVDDNGNKLFLYAWTDSLTTAPQGSETSTANDNL